jgi:hypothetical protein
LTDSDSNAWEPKTYVDVRDEVIQGRKARPHRESVVEESTQLPSDHHEKREKGAGRIVEV